MVTSRATILFENYSLIFKQANAYAKNIEFSYLRRLLEKSSIYAKTVGSLLNCKKMRLVKRKIFIRKRANNELIQQKLRGLANNFEWSLKHESLDAEWDTFQQGIQSIMILAY